MAWPHPRPLVSFLLRCFCDGLELLCELLTIERGFVLLSGVVWRSLEIAGSRLLHIHSYSFHIHAVCLRPGSILYEMHLFQPSRPCWCSRSCSPPFSPGRRTAWREVRGKSEKGAKGSISHLGLTPKTSEPIWFCHGPKSSVCKHRCWMTCGPRVPPNTPLGPR